VEQGIKYYREYYSVKGLYENFLYEGIENLLNELYKKGKNLFLVSVKPSKFIKDILFHFKIDKYFKEIYGSDISNINKSKEDLIKNLLENEKLDPENCVMVGDRAFDVIGAKYNEVKSIAVTYGYGTLNELKASKPNFLVNSINELSNVLLKKENRNI
jgi:phosphoglycolate phosphatase